MKKVTIQGKCLNIVGSARRSVNVKANEFVKKFGWDVSTKLSKEMRGITESVADGVAGWGQSEWDKLKRLVESHELVESKGGIELSKKEVRQRSIVRWVDPEVERLREAIADVESCQ